MSIEIVDKFDVVKRKRNFINETNTCEECGKELKIGHPKREYDKNGNWTGRLLYKNCYDKNDRKNNPNNLDNIKKHLTDSRNNNLDPDSTSAKGGLFEAITCKTRNRKNLNIEYDNFITPIDHDRDPELGILQTKGAIYNSIHRIWHNIWNSDFEKRKEFDSLIFYCMSKDRKNIERVYIFPKKEIIIRNGVTIYKNPTRTVWYEKYRVDEKPYNDAYHR